MQETNIWMNLNTVKTMSLELLQQNILYTVLLVSQQKQYLETLGTIGTYSKSSKEESGKHLAKQKYSWV